MNFSVEKLQASDAELFVQLRIDYILTDESFRPIYAKMSPQEITAMKTALADYFIKHNAEGTLIAVVAKEHKNIAATAFLSMYDKPPHPKNPNGKASTLYNVLTFPSYRRNGLASRLVQTLCDEEAKLGVSTVTLSATEEGKPVYTKLGFIPLNDEMILRLR